MKKHMFDIQIGVKAGTEDNFGYQLYEYEFDGKNMNFVGEWDPEFGFDSHDKALKAAKKMLNKVYGNGNWSF